MHCHCGCMFLVWIDYYYKGTVLLQIALPKMILQFAVILLKRPFLCCFSMLIAAV